MSEADPLALPEPDLSELGRPFWDALQQGQLSFQRCTACGHAWLPARSECPQCLAATWQREAAKGDATLVSWVVYRHAYQPAFAQRLPYTVAVVQLAEGPRMITNIVGAEPAQLRIDQPLRLQIEPDGELAVPRFKPA
ncbi:MAG TPA: OB-fold domain-containing protein [Ramlibacter sp.]|nr:OB-fold domain-containing protein [Ramlibacter sp.]